MLHVVDEGRGTVVVLLHAYPCDHTLWDEQAAALVAGGYRVVRPDLPGFGRSPLPAEARPDLRVMADAVFEALAELDVRTFALGGLSMGGYVAMQMLRQQPEQITALILADTKATPDAEAARAVREETARKALAAGSLVPLTDGMLAGLLGPTTREQRPLVVARTVSWITSASAPAAAFAMRAMAARPDSVPTLARFDAPALVIAGEEDALSPMAEHEIMAEALPHGRLVPIPNCGHLSAVERPEAVTGALVEFLDSLAG